MEKYAVVIPAYNEEEQIEDSVRCVLKASEKCSHEYELLKIFICVNGCTDNTELIIHRLIQEGLPIVKFTQRRRSYISALNTLFKYASDINSTFVIKVDADAFVRPDSFEILLSELMVHPELLIAGGHPLPMRFHYRSLWSYVMSYVLSIRSLYPESEVSKNDVSIYHPYAISNPQPIGSSFELRSKIYFHGRFWAIRSNRLIQIPNTQIGDDIYLTAHAYTILGPGSIRVRYDANCDYIPIHSLIRHIRVYRRIYRDLNLLRSKPIYKWYIDASRMKLNWSFILKQKRAVSSSFILYSLIILFEAIYFRVYRFSGTDWSYQRKQV